jgi:glycosyltransferase involved in cell wall biosynthesis
MTARHTSIGPETAARRLAKGQHRLAVGWLNRGRCRAAILSLQKALVIDPTYCEAHLELARIYQHQGRWRDLAAHCRAGFQQFMEIAELHKLLITALEELGSLEDAFACYDLKRRDQRGLDIAADEILCCLVARNERMRLPAFLDHYRRLGVDRFFVVDNGSSDGSVEWLLEQPDVHLWCSELSFKRANFGASWFELLLRRYGIDHWCLTLDADEFLVFEGSPERSLTSFCRDLDRRGIRVATGLLLDLYSDRPVQETLYHEGQDPLAVCPFFDRHRPATIYRQGGPYRNQDIYFGGVRQRVFPTEHDYLLSKAVLLRYQADVVLNPGQHLTNIEAKFHAREEICLLHFKFIASFERYARQEAERKVHAMAAEQYQAYTRRLDQSDSLVLYDPAHSLRYEGPAQLRALGLMRPEQPAPPLERPPIAPLTALTQDRPFWSVMVSVYNRIHNIERVLGSVLSQADDTMQIAVVCDFHDASSQAAITAEVARVGDGRVELYTLDQRAGHPHIFNRCIDLARGHWVHVLHDDDWLEPGFYQGLREGLTSVPHAGAAFCQQTIISRDGEDPSPWHSWAERETPGLIDDWLDRISQHCRVQFSAMVVRRDVYETLGGFSPAAGSAFDWEMWIRIAAHHAVFHLPEPLVVVGRDASAETTRLLRNGQQVRDGFLALDLAADQLPPERSEALLGKAREWLAGYALDLAERLEANQDAAASLANLRAAATGYPSARTRRRLVEWLQGERHEFKG